ncbi:MAG: ATP-binding protein [Planctomycetes bacterium]|nr:ATP-binding protein [Planctomycetota bacterium]
MRPGGGVLLHGPPGTGKTLVARGAAGEAGVPFFEARIPEILDKYVGETEKRLASLFGRARESAPSILFLDELDWLAADREEESGAVIRRLVPLLLGELETAAGSGVLVLAATNLPWRVDPALLRPGRFDVVLMVGLPDLAARRGILAARFEDRPLSAEVDLGVAAGLLAGATGAEVAEVAERAALQAFREAVETGREEEIGPAHLAAAAAGIVRSVSPETLARHERFSRERA